MQTINLTSRSLPPHQSGGEENRALDNACVSDGERKRSDECGQGTISATPVANFGLAAIA
jgi:hypothetical protein